MATPAASAASTGRGRSHFPRHLPRSDRHGRPSALVAPRAHEGGGVALLEQLPRARSTKGVAAPANADGVHHGALADHAGHTAHIVPLGGHYHPGGGGVGLEDGIQRKVGDECVGVHFSLHDPNDPEAEGVGVEAEAEADGCCLGLLRARMCEQNDKAKLYNVQK